MSIGAKLMASFGCILTLLLVFGASSLYSTENLADDVVTTGAVIARKLDLAGQLNSDIAEMRAAEKGAVAATALNETAELRSFAALFEEKRHRAENALTEIRPLLGAGREQQAAEALAAGLRSWAQAFEEMLPLCAAGKLQEANAIQKNNQAGAEAVSSAAVELLSAGRELLAESLSDAAGDRTRTRWMLIGAIVLSLLVAAVALLVVLRINRDLRKLASDLSAGAQQVASAASQVSAASQSLAQGSTEQAASLEETSASTQEINSMTQRNTENSRSAADLVTHSQQKVLETNHSLEQMIAAMTEISGSSDKISKIIKTIDEIAFQTNILALNAAVEAARAGEAGMGFAVVADEVRSLAQRCAQAARETADLIEESSGKSKDGRVKVDQVALAIHAVTEEGGRIKALVDEVSQGSNEQARGIEQIATAILQMEQVTQKTAAGAEESASAATQLTAQSEVLSNIVSRLTAMVGSAAQG